MDLSGLGLNQNRLQFGLGRMLSATTRLDVGYMIRSREDPTGRDHDPLLTARGPAAGALLMAGDGMAPNLNRLQRPALPP